MSLAEIYQELAQLGHTQTAAQLQRYFKTGPGEYGAEDIFRGIRVPVLRDLSAKYQDLSLPNAKALLSAPFHEDRLLALLILIRHYAKGDESTRAKIYQLYLQSTPFINNWDLVDTSAEHIIGAHLWNKNREPLIKLARSVSLWERRIAIMSTFHFIKRGEFADTLQVARLLLTDGEDLIHKAVGWMLREVGKRDLPTEKEFLRVYYGQMPRVMLRYAIEKFPTAERKQYLLGMI